MGDQNNNWSDKKWEDARNYSDNQNQNQKSIFGGGFSSQMRQYGSDYNSTKEGFMGNSVLRNGGKIGSGWLRGKNSMWVIIIVLLIVIIYTFYTQYALNQGITKSTIERTKIASTIEFDASRTKFFDDEAGIVTDDSTLITAADTFYDKTGVIPFIKFVSTDTAYSNEELTEMAEDYYAENFTDGEHFVIFFQPNLESTDYTSGVAVGETAKQVLDSEALQIFNDYLAKFYKQRQSNNQGYMVNTINYTANRIMTTREVSSTTIVFGIIVIVILIAIVVYMIKKKKDGPEEKEEDNDPRIENDENIISRRANQNVNK